MKSIDVNWYHEKWNCINELHELINQIHQSKLRIKIHIVQIKIWKWKFQLCMNPYQDHAHPLSRLNDSRRTEWRWLQSLSTSSESLSGSRTSSGPGPVTLIAVTIKLIANTNCTWNNHPYNYLHALALNWINPQITCRSPQWILSARQTSSSLHLRQWTAGS